MSFEFLKNIRFREAEAPKAVRSTSKNPEGLCLRVYRNGRVFPSKLLVEKFDLEYSDSDEAKGNGIDFFTAHSWGPYPKNHPNLLLMAFVSRKEPKVDLFLTRRNKETSVLTQAVTSKELWETVVSLHSEWAESDYIDIEVEAQTPITTEDGIYNLPKTVSRGEHKGTVKYVRRENITLYPTTIKGNVVIEVAQEITHEINTTQ